MAMNIPAMTLSLGDVMNSIDQALHESNEIDLSLLSTSHGSASSRSDTAQSSDANDADEDTDMSVDGGVHIPLTNSNAQQLNVEMDMLDAELMGPYNLAAIAPNNGFDGDIYQTDDSLENFTTYAQEDDGFGTSYAPSLNIGEPPDDDDAILQPALFVDPMSQLSQQLQNIQNGQALGGGHVVVSVGPNGAIPANGITSLTPPLVPSSLAMMPLELLSYISGMIAFGQDIAHPQMPPELVLYLSALGPPAAHYGSGVNVISESTMGLAVYVDIPDGNSDSSTEVNEDVYYDSELGGFQFGGGNITLMNEADISQVEDQRNLTLQDFLYTWGASVTRGNAKKRRRGPNLVSVERLRIEKPTQILQRDLRGDRCDFQGIDWTKLEVSRREAREKRNHSYRNYTNLRTPGWHDLTIKRSAIDNVESFYKFQRMDFKPRIGLAHFQLRNLLACTSRNSVFYAGDSKIYSASPLFNQRAVRMDLTDPIVQTPNSLPFTGIQISTLAADHNVLVAGGFSGEYAMVAADAPFGASHVEGLVTQDPNPITNHVQVHLSRQSGLPQVAFASNDGHLRVLDCTTNQFTSEHLYSYPINCSAISPDHRLRVLVGDSRNVIICNAETGDLVQALDGHEDYGFACAWADNGWHVATGNQDKLIKIWDARMWTDAYGVGKPLQTIAATVAGARSLKFSPLGSGKRVLVAAESADIVSVIDAESYATKQTLDFYGETCGVDFTPDGQRLFVGVHDPLRGGIMEFQRCGFGQYHGRTSRTYWDENGNPRSRTELEMHEMAAGLDWRPDTESVAADSRSRRTASYERRRAALSYDMEPF